MTKSMKVNILKSDLKADRAATLVKSGVSFKKLAKLIRRGSDMNMMNRLVETANDKKSGSGSGLSLVDTIKMIKNAKNPEPMLKQVTAVSNMKLLYKQE